MKNKYYKNKRKLSNRFKIIIAFSLALIITIIFYIINYQGDNRLLEIISENLIIQSVFIFLTSATLISLFLPFTFRKELNDKKVKKITSKEIKDYVENEKGNEWIKKENSL